MKRDTKVAVFISYNNKQFFLSKSDKQHYISSRFIPESFDPILVRLSFSAGDKINTMEKVKAMYEGFTPIQNPDVKFKL